MTAGSATAVATASRCSAPRSGSTAPRLRRRGQGRLERCDRRRGRGPAQGRRRGGGDRRRRLKRGGLPGPARSCARRSARLTSTPAHRAVPREQRLLQLAQPGLSARVRDIDDADAILLLGTDPLHSLPDPRPPHPQGDPPQAAPGSRWPPSARPHSTVAPWPSSRYAPGQRHALPHRAGRLPAPQRRGRARLTDRRAAAKRQERRRSSGASGSAARARAPCKPCSTWPRPLSSPRRTARACSKYPT